MTEVRQIMRMPIGIDVRDPGDVDVEIAFEWLREVDATFSTYREDSDIRRLDRGELTLAGCRPEVDEALGRCVILERATDGYFSVRPAGRLDPSGFVKGWAVAGAADRLAAAGAESFCINAGGDVVARGRPGPDRRWQVGIRHPAAPDELAALVAVEALAVATSGQYERGAHILDPHGGSRPPASCRSRSSDPTSQRRTPTRPPPSPWAPPRTTPRSGPGADGRGSTPRTEEDKRLARALEVSERGLKRR